MIESYLLKYKWFIFVLDEMRKDDGMTEIKFTNLKFQLFII